LKTETEVLGIPVRVPEGRLIVARRFNAGQVGKRISVP
jgi:hypothetical protein